MSNAAPQLSVMVDAPMSSRVGGAEWQSACATSGTRLSAQRACVLALLLGTCAVRPLSPLCTPPSHERSRAAVSPASSPLCRCCSPSPPLWPREQPPVLLPPCPVLYLCPQTRGLRAERRPCRVGQQAAGVHLCHCRCRPVRHHSGGRCAGGAKAAKESGLRWFLLCY
jgi:hypothetical protein